MELLFLIPFLLITGGVLVYFSSGGGQRPQLAHSSRGAAFAANLSTAEAPSRPSILAEPRVHRLSQTDVLLADTLTELLEVKEELAELRDQMSALTEEVEQLKSPAPRRRTAG
jgi:hypothetical protein